jgi:hypothetical protein
MSQEANEHLDAFEEALGVYVGPATAEEVVRAITSHEGAGADILLRLTGPGGELLWHREGQLAQALTGEDEGWRKTILVVNRMHEQMAGNPLAYVEAPLVLTLWHDERFRLDADLYSAGVRVRFWFGPLVGHVLTVVLWRSVYHSTESGDLAPGLGGFDVSVSEVEEESR